MCCLNKSIFVLNEVESATASPGLAGAAVAAEIASHAESGEKLGIGSCQREEAKMIRASPTGALSRAVSQKVTDLARGRKIMLQQVLQPAL